MAEIPNLPDIPEKVAEKLPTVDQWKKYGVAAVQYSFMILFLIMYLSDKFSDKDNCSDRIETLGKVVEDKDKQIKSLNERVKVLEEYIYVQAGIIKKVEDKVTNATENEVGGSQ